MAGSELLARRNLFLKGEYYVLSIGSNYSMNAGLVWG